MERLQGPINHWFFGEHLDVGCLEQGLANTDNLRFGDDKAFNISSTLDLEDKMPFLQMLQSVESPPFVSMKEPNFQALLRLQHLKKPWELNSYLPHQFETQIHALEFESCITNDIVELHSHSPIKSEARDFQHPHSSSCTNQNPNSGENHCKESNSGSTPSSVKLVQKAPKQTQNYNESPPSPRERRKRKRTRLSKNKEEVECQRMTHIAVERNRRRQMNDHLNVLKSLMPTSYIQRGDQASIVGGAIDFVKELEQLLQSLESRKRMRNSDGSKDGDNSVSSTSSSGLGSNGLFMFGSQCRIGSEEENSSIGNQLTVQIKSDAAAIEVTVIQTHVNLKVHCLRRPGQLLKAIVALEDLRLTVLHLNITSSQHTVFYSFNLKIEEGCKLGSAEEIAGAVHQIFKLIEGG